jgi:hypothetical protein
VQRILTRPGLQMQEVRAAQAHTDLGMTPEPDQLSLLVDAVAAPALERLGAV